MTRHKPLRRPPRTQRQRWDAIIRPELKRRFLRSEITSCECRQSGCWGANGLSFAHRMRRAQCNEAEMWITALSCIHCHQTYLDSGNAQEMHDRLQAIIDQRQPWQTAIIEAAPGF